MAVTWTAGIVETTGDDGPPTVEEWIPASVPGRPTELEGAEGPVAYRTTFEDPRGNPAERVRIELRGAYGRTRVWVNGERLGEADPYFVPGRLEFEPQPTNELVVECAPAGRAAGAYGTDAVPATVATPGIWWGAELQVRPPTFIRSLEAVPRLTDEGAVIDATVEVDAGERVDDAVTLSLRPEGFRGGGSMDRADVEAEAGERVRVSKTIRVRDPKRWWPREIGPQHRYTLRAKLGEDSAERTVGFRTVERDEDGFVVNGHRVRAHGVGVGPGAERADVRRAVEANATLVRPRGHVPSPAFYDACDDAGMLVWQDLPLEAAFDPAEAAALHELHTAQYGSHPCLAAYGLASDPEDPFAEPLGSGRLSRLRFRWRAWRADADREAVDRAAETLSGGLPVVPVSGPPGTDADATHLYPGWRYLEAADVEWLLDRYPSLGRTVGAFGAGSLTDGADPDGVAGLDAAALERRTTDPEASRADQAATVRTVAESLRRRGSGLLVADALRDVAPGGGMGVLANDGTEKPAYEALAAAFEPVQAVLDAPPEPGSVGITLVNDTADRLEATVSWRAGENDGETAADVDPFATTPAGTAEIPADATAITLECSANGGVVHNRYSL